jgi:GNAT superfamily N-acetyltransferase
MTETRTTIRAATVADLRAIRAIVDADEEPPDAAAGGFPEALDAYYRFLIEHGEVLVALDGERAVGFGATIDTGRGVHLADLFVVRDRQGEGIGRRLLEGCYLDRWPRTTFSSDDPRALPLYVRMGMAPLWPDLYVAGDARRLPAPAANLEVEPATPDAVAALERDWIGVDRPLVHRYWAGQPADVPLVVRRAGRAIAAGHARSRLRGGGRWMNTFLVAPDEEPHDPTLAALRWAADSEGRIGGCVPGPHPILPTLLAAGFRIADRDIHQASDAGLVDAGRSLVNVGIL